jgi:hypothetical protein
LEDSVAQRIIHQLIDDIDGTDISQGRGERVEFALRGVSYRIDLSDGNIDRLEKALAPFIASAEKIKGARGRPPGSNSPGSKNAAPTGSLPKEQLSAVRAWASRNGRKVSSRGRIPADVVAAYEAAHAS